jgi:phage baseplate assembly protein gpV
MSEQDVENLAQDRLLSNIAILGRVIATEYALETGMVRVRIGPEDEKSAEYDMPWIRRRGGKDWEWWAPEKDEQVLIISPDGDLDRALIVGSLPYKDFKDSMTPSEKLKRWVLPEGGKEPAPTDEKKDESTAHVVQYNDKTTTLYDKELHIFHATFLEKKTIDLKVDAKKDEEKAELKFKKGDTEKIGITIDALDKKENVNLKLKEDINIDAKRDEDKKEASIDIKVKKVTAKIDGKDGEEKINIDVNAKTKMLMDAKKESIEIESTGELTIKAKGITLTLDKQGGVTLDCKKLTVKSSGEVSVKGSAIKLNC